MTALRKLHLYGELADTYGATHDVLAATIPDAIRIVECNYPGFQRAIRHGRFHCAMGEALNDNAVDLGAHPHHLYVPRSQGDFHLMPVIAGSKSRSFKTIFSIVVGGALLATGIGGALALSSSVGIGAGAATAFTSGFLGLGLSYGTIALIGASFFLGGINMLLAPTPSGDTKERKPTAFSFDGPTNVADEGGPIPIILGEVITGGVTIASAVTTSATTLDGVLTGGAVPAGTTGTTNAGGITVGNGTGGTDVGGSGGGFREFNFARNVVEY